MATIIIIITIIIIAVVLVTNITIITGSGSAAVSFLVKCFRPKP